MWGEELNRQAATIAYLNDFRVLAIAAVIFIPLLFFMRRQAMWRGRRALTPEGAVPDAAATLI